MLAQLLIAADAFTVYKDLRCCVHLVLRLECIGLVACLEKMVFDLKTLSLKQILAFQAEWADMLFCHHPIEFSGGCLLSGIAMGHYIATVVTCQRLGNGTSTPVKPYRKRTFFD